MRASAGFVAGLIAGAIVGAGGMLVAFPFLFPLPVVDEKAPTSVAGGAAVETVARFRFDETAPGRDSVHWANGSGSILRTGAMTIVRLEDDFEAGPGPNYWIYLNTTPVGDETQFLADGGRVKIAPLKSFQRGQNYVLPEGVRLDGFATLTIWCESFSAYIASASLPAAR
jgi:hypothetical protein